MRARVLAGTGASEAAAGPDDAEGVLGGAGRMPGRECGQLCSSTAGLDTDLLMRRGAVRRVEAEARATTAQEQAKPRIYSTCTRERQGQASASICGLHSCSRLCANAAWGTLEETRPSSGHDTHANCGTDAGWCLLETETQRPAAKTHSAASWRARRRGFPDSRHSGGEVCVIIHTHFFFGGRVAALRLGRLGRP